MKWLIKKWSRKRRKRSRQRNDFSEDIRRAERKKQRSKSGLFRFFRKISAFVFRFREPAWAQSRPMTKRGTRRELLSRGSYFNPLIWIWGFVRFTGSWLASRPYGSIVPGLPAVAVTLGILGLVVWYRSSSGNWRDSVYRKHLSAALQSKDFPLALVSVNTLIDFHRADVQLQYQRALITREMDQPQLCDYYMNQLATANHVPAIMWVLSTHFNDGPANQWEAEKQNRYVAYVTELLNRARGSDLIVAKKLMGVYLAQIGATAEAIGYLSKLENDHPELLLTLATMHHQIGNQQRAHQYAADATIYLRSILAANPQDVQTRLHLAQAMTINGDWNECIRFLREGHLVNPDNRLSEALGEAYVGASLQLDNKARLRHVVKALEVAPGNRLVLDAMVQLLAETRDARDSDEESDELRQSILEGLPPKYFHFVKGTIAQLDGSDVQALKHFELAKSAGLESAGGLNNLAIAMAAKEGADLDQALKLVNGALELLPEHPLVLETRGQILLKMDRYQDAIRDLEKSLAGISDLSLRRVIIVNLITAYEGLGLPDMVESYRRDAVTVERLLEARGALNRDSSAVDPSTGQ